MDISWDGQKIVYFAIDLASEKNLKKFVRKLENWIIKILNNYKIESSNDPDNIGIWVNNNNNLEKVAAIGIRVKKWVAFHGFALNINVNKKNYNGIIPCGIKDKGIANMSDLIDLSNLENINEIIILEFKKRFQTCFEIFGIVALYFFILYYIQIQFYDLINTMGFYFFYLHT